MTTDARKQRAVAAGLGVAVIAFVGLTTLSGQQVPDTGSRRTSNGIVNTGATTLSGTQTFSTAGTSNNIALDATTTVLRYTGSGTATWTGFTGGANGRVLIVYNASVSASTVTLSHDTGSSTGNKIYGGLAIGANTGAAFVYDTADAHWRTWGSSSGIFANTLRADSVFAFNSESASTITSTQNDFAIGSGTNILRWAGAADVTFTGWSNVVAGKLVFFKNQSAASKLIFANDSSSSIAANRFYAPNSASLVCPPQSSGWAIYDNTATHWIVMGGSACYSQASNTALGNPFGSMATTGRYWPVPPTQSVATNAAMGVGTLRAINSYIPNPITVTRIATDVSSAGEAGSKVRLCIYGDDGTNHPGTLVVDAGQINGDSATVQELTISSAIGPGIYWFAAAVQNVAVTQPTLRTSSNWQGLPIDSGSSLPGAAQTNNGWQVTGVTAACPSTFGTGSVNTAAPRIFIRN